MFYRSDLSSVLVGSLTHGNEGLGYAFSAESGKRIGGRQRLAPDAAGAAFLFEGRFRQFCRSVRRAGVACAMPTACSDVPGLRSTIRRPGTMARGIVRSDIYGIANLHYEFLNGTNVDVAGTSFANAQRSAVGQHRRRRHL